MAAFWSGHKGKTSKVSGYVCMYIGFIYSVAILLSAKIDSQSALQQLGDLKSFLDLAAYDKSKFQALVKNQNSQWTWSIPEFW